MTFSFSPQTGAINGRRLIAGNPSDINVTLVGRMAPACLDYLVKIADTRSAGGLANACYSLASLCSFAGDRPLTLLLFRQFLEANDELVDETTARTRAGDVIPDPAVVL